MRIYLIDAGMHADADTLGIATMAWEYTLLFAALGRLLRGLFPSGPRGTRFARLGIPILLAVAWVGSLRLAL